MTQVDFMNRLAASEDLSDVVQKLKVVILGGLGVSLSYVFDWSLIYIYAKYTKCNYQCMLLVDHRHPRPEADIITRCHHVRRGERADQRERAVRLPDGVAQGCSEAC